MAKNDDELEELKHTVEELKKCQEQQLLEKEVNKRVSAAVKMRCAAAISAGMMIISFLGWLASKVSDALDAGFRAFIKALTAGAAK